MLYRNASEDLTLMKVEKENTCTDRGIVHTEKEADLQEKQCFNHKGKRNKDCSNLDLYEAVVRNQKSCLYFILNN